ncbi:MAG: hypothetical protein IJZ79_01375 [Bacilli bacterium]|nr:hypothetical protein [Bacilli bacterium]
MYNLTSGDIDNAKHLYALETFSTLKETIKRNRTLYNVQQSLFENSFTEEDYDDIACALTMGDELSVPISYEEARVLFFALNVNTHNINSRVRSIAKAYMFYQEFEGDYKNVVFIDTKSSIIHLAKIFYRDVVPGISIQYKIPFYVVNSSRGYHFTIAECDKYTILVNDLAHQITRKSFNRLLESRYANSFRNHEEVMNSINCSIEVLLECLEDAEFTKKIIDFPFNNAMCIEVSSDNAIYAWDKPVIDSEDWILQNNKYRLNCKYTNIVALMPLESEMNIYII